jgi:hypothetical protein
MPVKQGLLRFWMVLFGLFHVPQALPNRFYQLRSITNGFLNFRHPFPTVSNCSM